MSRCGEPAAGHAGEAPRGGVYRPRSPRASPLYQCAARHAGELRAAGRFQRAVEKRTIERFLECGDAHFGFARIWCDACGHDYLLAYSCKTRYFCPSCHQKRVLLYGEWVEEHVLEPVPHRQYVFTVPRLLRPIFGRHRPWLGELCRIAARLLVDAYAEAAPGARPGLILFVQTFGDLANFNPHVHVLAADGAFFPNGAFVRLPAVPEGLLAEGFRRAVLELLAENEAISEELRSKLLGWRYSGFSAHNQVRVGAEDAEGRKKLAGYMLRAPISLEKMRYDAATGTVIYRSKMHAGLKRNFQVMPGAEWLELLCRHVPDRYRSTWCATSAGIRTARAASAHTKTRAAQAHTRVRSSRSPSMLPAPRPPGRGSSARSTKPIRSSARSARARCASSRSSMIIGSFGASSSTWGAGRPSRPGVRRRLAPRRGPPTRACH